MAELQNITGQYKLDEIDNAIIRLYKSFPGITQEEIGKEVNLTRENVSVRLNSRKVQHVLKQLAKEALDILREAQNEAARTILEIMRDKTAPTSVRLNAAIEVIGGKNRAPISIEVSTKEKAEQWMEMLGLPNLNGIDLTKRPVSN